MSKVGDDIAAALEGETIQSVTEDDGWLRIRTTTGRIVDIQWSAVLAPDSRP